MVLLVYLLLLTPLCCVGSILCMPSRYIAKFTLLLNSFLVILASCILTLIKHKNYFIHYIPWLNLSHIMVIYIDYITAIMLLFLLILFFIIQYYALCSFANNKYYFILTYIFLFTCLGILLSGQIFFCFIFWEWMGIISYFLIIFHKQNKVTFRQGKIIFLINKIGDLCFFIGLFLVFVNQKQICRYIWIKDIIYHSNLSLGIIIMLLGLGTKSAQFPLMHWLPIAMVAPMPVSALLHSATLVIMGIYLSLRLSYLFTPDISLGILYVGIITAFWGGYQACRSWHIKKLLAYSTVSQIGFMSLAIGLGAYTTAFMHMLVHGIIKSYLFLCAGIIIQDMKQQKWLLQYSGDLRFVQYRYGSYTVLVLYCFGACCLIGFPYFPCWYTKEALVMHMVNWAFQYIQHGYYFYILPLLIFLFSVLLTVVYLLKSIIFILKKQVLYIRHTVLPYNYSISLGLLTLVCIGLMSVSLDYQDHWLWRTIAQGDTVLIDLVVEEKKIRLGIGIIFLFGLGITWKKYCGIESKGKKLVTGIQVVESNSLLKVFSSNAYIKLLYGVEKIEQTIEKIYHKGIKVIYALAEIFTTLSRYINLCIGLFHNKKIYLRRKKVIDIQKVWTYLFLIIACILIYTIIEICFMHKKIKI